MKKYQRLSLLLVALLLGGCAELSQLSGDGSDAPIEERTASASASATPATGAATTAAQPGAATGPMVETHALPASGNAQGQAIEASAMPAAIGGGRVVGVTPEQAAMLRDPNNPLSKRVIYFDFDSDAIRDEFRGLIDAHAGFLKSNGAARIILQGHTDERGSRDYNLALGQRRSESVRQALGLLGVQNEQVETVSLGEEKPIQEGHDEAAWKQNRRAEIHYLGE
jgi:peptidoglycan-associated lipoprotein